MFKRLDVFDGFSVDNGAYRKFLALGARYVGDLQHPGRHMTRRGMAAQGLFDTPWIHLGGLFPTPLYHGSVFGELSGSAELAEDRAAELAERLASKSMIYITARLLDLGRHIPVPRGHSD